MYEPYSVMWWYRGKCCGSTTFGNREAAYAFKAALIKRGVRLVAVSKV
jgi:hypothetical protein